MLDLKNETLYALVLFIPAAPILVTCDEEMRIDIPKCMLDGMKLSDLQFANDASCDITKSTEESELYFKITVSNLLCGIDINVSTLN